MQKNSRETAAFKQSAVQNQHNRQLASCGTRVRRQTAVLAYIYHKLLHLLLVHAAASADITGHFVSLCI
jgi:hypothetical protein